jgi:hypothetical protein
VVGFDSLQVSQPCVVHNAYRSKHAPDSLKQGRAAERAESEFKAVDAESEFEAGDKMITHW